MRRRTLYLRFLWWLLVLGWVDWLCLLRRARPQRKRVLIVRLDAIGDYLLWSSYGATLRERYPRDTHHVTLLGNALWCDLARESGVFDEVWSLSRRRFVLDPRYRYRLLRRVGEAGFATVIHPTYGRDFLWGDCVVRCSGAPERIGYQGNVYLLAAPQRWLSDRWYSRLIAAAPGVRPMLAHNAGFLRALDIEPPRQLHALPLTAPLPKELAADPYFVLAPGASKAIKRWPVDRFAEIAERLQRRTGWTAVVCGGVADRSLGQALAARVSGRLLDLTGRTSIAELATVIAGARFLLTNDSAPLHFAALHGTPALAIAGGGHFGQFVPYPDDVVDNRPLPQTLTRQMPCFGCDWNCIYPRRDSDAAPCVDEVACDEVWDALCGQLERAGEPPG